MENSQDKGTPSEPLDVEKSQDQGEDVNVLKAKAETYKTEAKEAKEQLRQMKAKIKELESKSQQTEVSQDELTQLRQTTEKMSKELSLFKNQERVKKAFGDKVPVNESVYKYALRDAAEAGVLDEEDLADWVEDWVEANSGFFKTEKTPLTSPVQGTKIETPKAQPKPEDLIENYRSVSNPLKSYSREEFIRMSEDLKKAARSKFNIKE